MSRTDAKDEKNQVLGGSVNGKRERRKTPTPYTPHPVFIRDFVSKSWIEQSLMMHQQQLRLLYLNSSLLLHTHTLLISSY
jgi:hypothetical protein